MDRNEAIRHLKAFRTAYQDYWFNIVVGGVPGDQMSGERQRLAEILPLIEQLVEDVGESAQPLRQTPFNRAFIQMVTTTLDRAIGCYKAGIRSKAASGQREPRGEPEGRSLKERIENHPLAWAWRIALAAFILGGSAGYFVRDLVDAAVKRYEQHHQAQEAPPARWGK